MKDVALDEQVCNPLHSPAHDRCSDAPGESEMEGGAILAPVLQGQEELVLQRELYRPSRLGFPLPMFPEDMPHRIESLKMNTARALAILRLQVLYLRVGHWPPSYDLFWPPSPDFCKRSNELSVCVQAW